MLNNQQNEIVETIRLKAVDAGASKLLDATAGAAGRITVNLKDATEAAKSVGLSVEDFAARTGIVLEDATADVGRLGQAWEGVRRAAEQAGNASASAGQKSAQGGGFDVNRVQGIVGQAGGLLSVAGGSAGQVGGALSSVLALTQSLGPLGIAAGIGTTALLAATDAENKRAEAAKNAADRLNEIVSAGTGGATTESINRQIADAERQRDSLQEVQSQLELLATYAEGVKALWGEGRISAEQYQERLQAIGQEIDDLTGGAVTAAGGVLDLNKLLDDNQSSIGNVNSQLAIYNAQLDTSAVKINDLQVEAEREAAEQLKQAEFLRQADQMTAEQREERMAQIAREIALLSEQISGGELNAQAQQKLGERQAELYEQYTLLESVTNSYADLLAREKREKQAITDQNQNYLDALALEGNIRDKMAATVREIADLQAKAAEDAAEAAAQREERLLEIAADGEERREDVLEDSAERRTKIERDAARSERDAQRNRDVVAAIQARERAKDALDDQAEADEKRLLQVEETLEKQQEAVDKSYKAQLSTIDDGVRRQLAVLRQAQTQQQVDLVNVQNAQIAIASAGSGGLQTIAVNTWNSLTNTAYEGGLNMARAFQNGLNAFAGWQPLPAAPTSTYAPQNDFTRAVQGIVDTRLRQIWE